MQMPLTEYISKNFNGDLHRYAQYAGVSFEEIINWINKECYVIKGRLFIPVKHLATETSE